MVGGGRDAFIGAVHRHAAALDGQIDFVAGALSSTPEKARASGQDLGLADDRNYGSWQAMLAGELARPAGERIDFVSIVTPNDVHYPVARAFAEAGINVVCDKPLVHTVEQADDLVATARQSGVVFAVTYNYTGYPMVKQARHMVREGQLGELRKVIVEYNQGWLATRLEETGLKQANWRTDPARSGVAGAIGDIGSHAENLAATITGLEIDAICADLTTFVSGRQLDDDGNLLIRYTSGARGVLIASQIEVGEENDLRIRIYGSEGSLTWHQEDPDLPDPQVAGGTHAGDDPRRRLPVRGGAARHPDPSRAPGGLPGGVRQRLSGRRGRHSGPPGGPRARPARGRLPDARRRRSGRPLHHQNGREQPQRRQVARRPLARLSGGPALPLPVVESPVLRGLLETPSPEALLAFLKEYLRAGDTLVQVAGECEVYYHGRAASVADAGDFLVLVKHDGSLQVQGATGIKPINWQPVSDHVQLDLEDGRAVLVSERFNPAEVVRIVFLEPALALALTLREVGGFVLMGSEAEMQRARASAPQLIEKGLTLLDVELPTEVGGIDLYARDRDGRLVVVELKRGKATQEAVHQLMRYVERVRELVGEGVRGILAAPDISKPALERLQELALEFREVRALPIEAAAEQQPPLFDG